MSRICRLPVDIARLFTTRPTGIVACQLRHRDGVLQPHRWVLQGCAVNAVAQRMIRIQLQGQVASRIIGTQESKPTSRKATTHGGCCIPNLTATSASAMSSTELMHAIELFSNQVETKPKTCHKKHCYTTKITPESFPKSLPRA